MTAEEIFSAIEQYAQAYARLEAIQRSKEKIMPLGDQKTGVIAEYFAMLYAKSRFPQSPATFYTGAWDIRVEHDSARSTLIQVKAVSDFSGTSRISPIKAKKEAEESFWDELWLMRLSKKLLPVGFWIIRKNDVTWSGRTLKHRTMPRRGQPNSGSAEFKTAEDCLPKLWDVLRAAYLELPELAVALASYESEIAVIAARNTL